MPRLIDGNVAIQAFTLVTTMPRAADITQNDPNSDLMTRAAVLQRWPLRTWGDLTERALFQAGKLTRFAERSDGRLTLIKTRGDLDEYLAARSTNSELTAGFLGIEGAHALEGELANLDRLFEAGIRMVGRKIMGDNAVRALAEVLPE